MVQNLWVETIITKLNFKLLLSGTRLTLKKYDFCRLLFNDCRYVAENISSFYFENVNLLGNKFSALAGYLLTASTPSDDGTYNSEFVNCTSLC